MRAVILAAGEGSRMGDHVGEVPKAFMDLRGRTLYDRQRTTLEGHVDATTVVLGYAADNVTDRIDDAEVVVVEDWDEYDNAESLRRALRSVDGEDDVLVLNGDVLVAESIVEQVVDRHRRTPAGRNVVACTPQRDPDSTAIRCDDRGVVTDYGLIDGTKHAGLGVVDAANVDAVERYLRPRGHEWYPVCYPAFETERAVVPASQHVEINRPSDKLAAERLLPLAASGEADADAES